MELYKSDLATQMMFLVDWLLAFYTSTRNIGLLPHSLYLSPEFDSDNDIG